MEGKGFFEERDVPLGLGVEDLELTVRRQFAGSVVAAVLIAAAALLIEMRPVHRDTAAVSPSRTAGARAFTLAAPPEQRMVAVKRLEIELP